MGCSAGHASRTRATCPPASRVPVSAGEPMNEQRKHALLLAATILAARKLADCDDKPTPRSMAAIEEAVRKAERILEAIDRRYPPPRPH